MDVPLLLARVLHIVLGVFWAGALIFNALFLLPAIRDAGPEGAKVGAALMRRRFLDVMPVVAALTLLSGFWLYWRVSAGFASAYMRSPMAMTYGAGALSAVAAFGLGVGIVRRSMLGAAALSQAAASAPPEQREAQLAGAQSLRLRAFRAAQAVAWLLGLALVTMAVGRYV